MANALLMNISNDPDQRALYLSRSRYEMDLTHRMAVAKDEGKAEVARKLLLRGRPLAEISEDTGLSVREIETLM